MKRISYIISLLLLFPMFLDAQQASFRQTFQIGLVGDYAHNIYTADFDKLPGSLCSCKTNFTEGSGDGYRVGLFARVPFTNSFSLDVAFAYTSQSGSLSRDIESAIAVFPDSSVTPVSGLLRQTLDAVIRTISIEPQVNYHFYDAFRLSLGAQIFYVMKDTCLQVERIIKPDGVYFFRSGSKEWTMYSGAIPEMRKFLASLSIGLGYDFTGGFISPLIISPEISYSFGLMNIIQGIDWKLNALRAGLRISVPLGGGITE